jgi:hypothetical protein
MKIKENAKELSIDDRLNICMHCPIYNYDSDTCNQYLYINPDNDDVSDKPKKGYVKGCGCYIPTKVQRRENHCIVDKW